MKPFNRLVACCLLILAGGAIGCSKDIKIGAVVSETGGVSPYGRKVMRGLDLALEEINNAGGVNGGKVQLIYKNDATPTLLIIIEVDATNGQANSKGKFKAEMIVANTHEGAYASIREIKCKIIR